MSLTGRESMKRAGRRARTKSALGAGSTFSFVLEFPLGAAQRRRPIESGAPPPSLKGARVLVVEDNEINQHVARQLLESAGVEVTLVSNGLEAVSAATAGDARYDAILMDLQMPELDGYQATRAIRSHPRGAQLPIIATTAHTLELEQERCREAGMNAHVAKPVEPAQLYATFAQWARPAQGSVVESGEALIPGIDFETALRRVRNNRRLLLRLLGELARTWRDGSVRSAGTWRRQSPRWLGAPLIPSREPPRIWAPIPWRRRRSAWSARSRRKNRRRRRRPSTNSKSSCRACAARWTSGYRARAPEPLSLAGRALRYNSAHEDLHEDRRRRAHRAVRWRARAQE